MMYELLKFMLGCIGTGFGFISAAALLSVITDRPSRIKRFREEGYDNAIEDIIKRKWYWDRKEQIYKNVELYEIPTNLISGNKLKTFFNRLYYYRGEAVIKTIEDAMNDKWEDAEPINQWQELHKYR